MNFVRDRARAWDNTKFELDQLRRWLKKQMSWSLIFPSSVWPWKKSKVTLKMSKCELEKRSVIKTDTGRGYWHAKLDSVSKEKKKKSTINVYVITELTLIIPIDWAWLFTSQKFHCCKNLNVYRYTKNITVCSNYENLPCSSIYSSLLRTAKHTHTKSYRCIR